MEEKESKLKPCPFCGGNAILYIDCGYYIAECENCEAMSGEHKTAEETIEAWNKRVEVTE
jgi:Lar family restriction alleviation protein